RRLPADEDHRSGRLDEVGFVDSVTFFLLEDGVDDELSYLFARLTSPQAIANVVIHHREQAGSDIAVGGQPKSRTLAAKWHGHRRDNPYLTGGAVGESISERSLARRVPLNRNELVPFLDSIDNFAPAHKHAAVPLMTIVEGHVLDETHRN